MQEFIHAWLEQHSRRAVGVRMTINPLWEKIFAARGWGTRPDDTVVKMVNSMNPARVLEVGCGYGANLRYLVTKGIEVHGIDGSDTGVEATKKNLEAIDPEWKGSIQLGDITKIPFPDASFDLVIDVEAISANSAEDARKIYEEISRVLKTDGRMLSITFSDDTYTGVMAEGVTTRLETLEGVQGLLDGLFASVRIWKRGSELISDPHVDRHIKQWVIEAIK